VNDARTLLFVMAGGGTGGHVIPAIAVAREIEKLGHSALFVGTKRGVESRLVPGAGFRLEMIRVGGIKGLGLARSISSAYRLVAETLGQIRRFAEWRPAAVFSMGGYVAGPPVLAALMRGVPLVVMEPNAVPGFTNRAIGRFVSRALISFPETERFVCLEVNGDGLYRHASKVHLACTCVKGASSSVPVIGQRRGASIGLSGRVGNHLPTTTTGRHRRSPVRVLGHC